MTDLAAHETALFTALSVACEELEAIINSTLSGVRHGFVAAALRNARKECDLFLDDRDAIHIAKAQGILQGASAQLQEWEV